MKKKITAGFLAALLILGLCSCGGKTGEETKPVQEAESTALSGLTVKPASDEAPVPEETPEPEKTPEPIDVIPSLSRTDFTRAQFISDPPHGASVKNETEFDE